MGTLRFASGNLFVSRSAALAAAVSVLLTLLLWGSSSAQATTKVFSSTGGEQTFVVPGGVTELHVLLIGGAGGASSGAGGAAAKVTADLEVTPGQTLYIQVAGLGQSAGEGGAGGFNGGGAGGGGAGGGGGASDIRLLPRASGLSPDTRLVVAGGGGGGAGAGNEAGGAGGNAGSPGAVDEGGTNGGGGAGTESEGGAGGSGCSGTGISGSLGAGGAGDNGEFGTNSGGGGGAGFYGGGGGSGGCTFGGGGGGGGSSFVPVGGELEIASLSASPRIVVTYTLPPSISIASPIDGATYAQGQAVAAAYSCSGDEVGITSCAGTVANGAAVDTATPGAHSFTVKAKDGEGGESSKTVSYTVEAPPLPNATIASHPRKVIKTAAKRVKVKFTFHSPTAGATFQCKLDKGAYVACASPKKYKVKVGKHKFLVRAVKDGRVDPTPASFKFKVVKKTT